MQSNPVSPGKYYRHFRGKIYKVIGVALHTETEEPMVVYQAQYGDTKLFVRPLAMFTEELDEKRYPEAKQKFRFELIKDYKTDLL